MPAADGVDARARRVAARLLPTLGRRSPQRPAGSGDGGRSAIARHVVGGHPARVTSTGDVYLADGVNILHLTGQRLAGVSVVDTSLGVLSVLSASAGQTRG